MRISDWSSDVCSSDLQVGRLVLFGRQSLALWRDVTAIGLLARFTGLVLVVVAMLETNGVHVYLAQAGRDRTHFGVHAIGQVLLHALQTFTNLLTGEINVHGVQKDGRSEERMVGKGGPGRLNSGGRGHF